MFNPAFFFENTDTPCVSASYGRSNENIYPVHRFVDTLIKQYRDEQAIGSDLDDPVILKNSNPKEESGGSFQLTDLDVVRDKKLRRGKHKAQEEKYVFRHAVDKYRAVPSFLSFKLSKPLLKCLTEMSMDKPTPIQCACIPVALLNHDICACARTGSGKTLAFMLPILERLTKRPLTGGRTVTRALIVSPTRELAVQTFKVTEMLVRYCPKMRVQLAAGGLDLHSQEASLRLSPDLVIATPGRLIDHLSNAPNFSLQHIEYLVLDEADKLLDEYFVEQIGEIVKHCGKQRQTLLFSATMTQSVKELATLSLKDPVQIFLNQATAVAKRLRQEFVRIRPHREVDRQAVLVALLVRNFQRRSIVFFQTKKECHRMHILLSLLGLSCAELHGNMSQALRLDALRRFSEAGDERVRSIGDDLIPPGHDASDSGSRNLTKVPPVDILLATDLAARGLDIPNVQTVLNYTLPQTMKKYVHRVGRTARAANSGRAVSLVGEGDRKLLKQIMKEAPYPVQSRVVPSEVVARFRAKLAKLDPVVEEILVRESEERELRSAQAQLQKAEDLISKGPSSKQTATSTRQRVDWFADRKKKQKLEPLSNRTMKSAKRKLRQSSDSD